MFYELKITQVDRSNYFSTDISTTFKFHKTTGKLSLIYCFKTTVYISLIKTNQVLFTGKIMRVVLKNATLP